MKHQISTSPVTWNAQSVGSRGCWDSSIHRASSRLSDQYSVLPRGPCFLPSPCPLPAGAPKLLLYSRALHSSSLLTLRPHDEVLRASLCLICCLSFKKSVLKSRNRKEVTDHSTNGPQNTSRQEMHPTSLPQGE